MSTTAVPAVIDYIVNTATASATLGAAASPNTVTVFDGPQVIEQWPQLCLWVGVQVDWLMQESFTHPEAARSQQQWVGPGARKRNETLSINMVADAWTGSAGIRGARVNAAAIMAAFEDMTRLDANQGGNVLFTDPGVTNAVWYQIPTELGTRILIAFDFTCFARIGT